ncbi:MAG: hypothetical protein JWN34_149, partial [Bryobacterales bacterium]|nr:hypothetical protein [Bryobacterales bacterium]
VRQRKQKRVLVRGDESTLVEQSLNVDDELDLLVGGGRHRWSGKYSGRGQATRPCLRTGVKPSARRDAWTDPAPEHDAQGP